MGMNLSKTATNDLMIKCFSDLPEPIIAEIISRLPIQSIIQCRCVCKAWLRLVSSRYFNNFVLKKNMSSLNFILSVGRYGCYLFEFPNRTSLTKNFRYPIKPMKLNFKFCAPFSGISSKIGTCNGLVCLSECVGRSRFIHLWNPVLGQYITFPAGSYDITPYGYGFGYCQLTDHYKVIRIDKNKKAFSVEVITLGATDNTWRMIGITHKRPNGLLNFCYFNGIIHWVSEDDDDDSSRAGLEICSFNCCTEQLGFIFPPPFDYSTRYDRHRRSFSYKKLTVVRDCLCVVEVTFTRFALWTMKDYGVADSWSKHLYVELPHSMRLNSTIFVSTLWGDDKDFCFRQVSGDMGYFDSKRMEYVKLKTTVDDDKRYGKGSVFPYFPSFVPLFEVFKEEPSKMLIVDTEKGCYRVLLSILKKLCFS